MSQRAGLHLTMFNIQSVHIFGRQAVSGLLLRRSGEGQRGGEASVSAYYLSALRWEEP